MPLIGTPRSSIQIIPQAYSLPEFALMIKGASQCNLAQAQYTETLFPLLTLQAFDYEAVPVTIFHVFARYGCTGAIEYYLGQGYDPDMINKIENYQVLINQRGMVLPDHVYTTYNAVTPLMYAIDWNQIPIAQILLNAGANVNAKDIYTNATPLMHAAREDQATFVTTLLNAGADYHAVDLNNQTALDIATLAGFTDVVNIINAWALIHP